MTICRDYDVSLLKRLFLCYFDFKVVFVISMFVYYNNNVCILLVGNVLMYVFLILVFINKYIQISCTTHHESINPSTIHK